MGASGIYSMIMVISPTMVPAERFPKYMAVVSAVVVMANILGPVLGGVINENESQWRWVFLLKLDHFLIPQAPILSSLINLF